MVQLVNLQFCNHRGYIKLNRSKFEKDLRELRNNIERELLGERPLLPTEDQVNNFVRSNAYILSGFVAGCLLGYGLA